MKILAAACVAAFLLPVSAHGVPAESCGPHDQIARTLRQDYGESPVWEGVCPSGRCLFELWTAGEGGTWSLLQIWPEGRACLRAAGEGWLDRDAVSDRERSEGT